MNALRRRYLAQIGIPVFELRERVPGVDTLEKAPRAGDPGRLEPAAAGVGPAACDPGRRSGAEPAEAAAVPAGSASLCEAAAVPADSASLWHALEAEVAGCTRCMLHRHRRQTVFGVGRRDASLMIVGEAPGAEEDRQGEPFVGPAGQLLNAMLRAIGLAREEVFIANVLKCRPPSNRDPSPEEAAACADHLERQIALVRPRAMLAVGRVAAQRLLQSDTPIGRLRGSIHRYGDVPLVVTYHPAYLLRTPLAKAKSWQDLCMIRELVTARP